MDYDKVTWSVIGQRNVTFDTVVKGQARDHQTPVFEALQKKPKGSVAGAT